MGLHYFFCINKTGKTCNIVDVNSGKTVGALYNREAFVLYGSEGDLATIKFLDPNGTFKTATVSISNTPCLKNRTLCTAYPYGTMTKNGKQYYTYKMRATKNLYTPSGAVCGTVSSGMLVATTNAQTGVSMNYLKEINYYQSGSSKTWTKVNGNDFGYVDTGIKSASGYSSIPFYGSW